MINTSKIRTIREKKGFSQEYMASKLRISQPVYARMESGQKKIEAGLLFKIAEELEEPIQAFLDQNGNTFHIQSQTFEPHAAFIQHVYSEQKELYEEQIKMLREEMTEMRKERQELIAILKGKL